MPHPSSSRSIRHPRDDIVHSNFGANPQFLDAGELDAIVRALSSKTSGPWCTQRSTPRHAVLCRGLVWRDADEHGREPIRAQLVDLSSGGVGLLSGTPFQSCERLVFEMTVQGIGPVLWKCVVRWCAPTDDGIQRIGAQFVEMMPAAG